MTVVASEIDIAKRRRLGQVFTPRPIADWMARWVCEERPRRVLDPAVGHGVFVEAIEGLGTSSAPPVVEVCDIDAGMLTRFAAVPRSVAFECRRSDFVTARFRGRYDAIIANPPYVRHHDMDYGEDVLGRFDRICGRRLSRMTNLYGLFLIKIWTLLGDRGRAAVITPAEWLNADFGVAIKAFLLEENAIDAIVHFDHASNVFDGALTTAAITLLRRGRSDGEAIRLLHVSDIGELTAARVARGRRVRPAELDPRGKWTPLFNGSESPSRNPGTAPAISRCHTALRLGCAGRVVAGPRLADIARCTRGIATGANEYFTIRESDRRRWGIDLRDLRICITKAQDVRGDRFTAADVQRLIDADRRIYLLQPRPRLTAAVKRYLAEGERRRVHRRYLPSHRPVWYMPEHREPAPILVSVFARGEFRFALNQAGALNLTPYHAIYLRDPSRERVNALFEYLASPAAQEALASHRRIYGDGLLKLEPRDVEAIPIPGELGRLCRPRS
jgi:adenine-specific DNA-methyltransferase